MDDDATVRLTLARQIARLGYAVVEAASGREAIDLFRRHSGQFGLILLDVTMPGMNGDAVLRELQPGGGGGVPVLVMSGYSQQSVEELFLGCRVDAFIQKPFTFEQLAAHVDRALRMADRPH